MALSTVSAWQRSCRKRSGGCCLMALAANRRCHASPSACRVARPVSASAHAPVPAAALLGGYHAAYGIRERRACCVHVRRRAEPQFGPSQGVRACTGRRRPPSTALRAASVCAAHGRGTARRLRPSARCPPGRERPRGHPRSGSSIIERATVGAVATAWIHDGSGGAVLRHDQSCSDMRPALPCTRIRGRGTSAGEYLEGIRGVSRKCRWVLGRRGRK